MREIRATLSLLGSEAGGRDTPIASGYRPAFYIGELQTDGAIELPGSCKQTPGETLSVRIRLLHPERFGDALAVGAVFEVREGTKTVGRGTITKL